MSFPIDSELYEIAKQTIYARMPTHSAYRSGHVVKYYKQLFRNKYGPDIEPYSVTYSHHRGLPRWFHEEWTNQRGEVGYKYKSDIYRPNYRVTSETPITFSELSSQQIQKARRAKTKYGRVSRFN